MDNLNLPTILKDPFTYAGVVRISTHCYKGSMSGIWRFTGTVEFVNGNTNGSQDFEGKDVKELHTQMNTFLESLKTTQ